MKRQAIKIWLTEGQMASIQHRGDLHDYCSRRGSDSLEESISKQIVKQASKLFPEVEERERQRILARNIQNAEHRSKGVSAISAGYETKMEELREQQRRLSTEIVKIDQEMEEKIKAFFNQKFDEAGITLFRSGYPHGLFFDSSLGKSK